MKPVARWKIINSEFAIDNRWCKVRRDEVELPNGVRVDDYFVNVRPDVVLILAVTPDREVVFVRQYRHGVGEILLELPGGTFYADRETCLEAAARELEEETGYIARTWTHLATLYDNPVKDTNKIYIAIAENALEESYQQLDITEAVEVVRVPIAEIIEKIANGELTVAGTISALLMGLKYLNYFDIIPRESEPEKSTDSVNSDPTQND
ncbi:NUDIX hydrolase [Oscillatoria sp. FACHB-1406]|uniref:NUDIX hydrolase n=1 Tax=Oscillatoria sp. FACHB-1406 TaxID=2692846 RepID=UPI001684B16E|nr:NUDIX hydrolase [Oscillatoria sp. FACHB-1406]MBD2578668.1 NUDIX hydrolase [Oscillatoria sp. FACHB-1406]